MIDIATAMDKIPTDKTIAMTMTTMALSEAANAVSKVEPVMVENTKKIVDEIIRISEIKETSKYSATETFTNTINAAVASNEKGNTGKSAPTTIILQLDGQILDKYVIDLVQKEFNPRRA
jgi:hypothetical protein